MNKHELQTVRQEAQRYSKDAKVELIKDLEAAKISLPYELHGIGSLYFFIAKKKNSKKFMLMLPVESAGLMAVAETMSRLQPLLTTYGLIITAESVILEDSTKPLNQRIRLMTQALLGIDGIRRLWKSEYKRSSNGIEG